jgi:hypothetical protein
MAIKNKKLEPTFKIIHQLLRLFNIVECQDGKMVSNEWHISELLDPDNNLETVYALQELGLDDVLDMKVGESMYFRPNRDNIHSKAIIFRMK